MSPQWGKCSKGKGIVVIVGNTEFQSPQWGKCSKVYLVTPGDESAGFSPRNGESVLKGMPLMLETVLQACFSPRNGESVLKLVLITKDMNILVSVPAMGKVF